jgi:hypothetical protein
MPPSGRFAAPERSLQQHAAGENKVLALRDVND